MSVSSRHILKQGAVFSALARATASAIASRLRKANGPRSKGMGRERSEGLRGGRPNGFTSLGEGTEIQSPQKEWIRRTIPPRSPALIRDYVKHVGGDPSAYRETIPPHLFPQWVFPLQAEVLATVDYPLHKAVNGGARIEVRGPLPQRVPLVVATRLDSIDDDGRRAILRFVATTGTREEPELQTARLDAFVPLARKSEGDKKPKDRHRVPADAHEVAQWRLRSDAGLDFAKLTGDFNPIHWIPPYARAMGFRNVILHGFGSMARAFESIASVRYAGDVTRLRMFEVRFTRPLVLPARPSLYLQDERFFVGDAPGAPSYAIGQYR